MTLYEQLLATARNAEISIIPKARQHQLLALAFLYGDEPFVFNERLRADTQYAANQNGIEAGKVPDATSITAIGEFVNEIRSGARPEWLEAIESIYDISFPVWDDTWMHKQDWKELIHGGIRVPPRQHGETGQ